MHMPFIKHWFPPAVFAAFIFYMSSQSNIDVPLFPYADKIIHVGVYTVLGYLIARALTKAHQLKYWQVVLMTCLIAGFYGFSDEIHQTFVPTRSAEIMDLASDFIGGLLGGALYGYVPRVTKKS